MFDLTTYVKKWQIRQLKTVFSTLDTLCSDSNIIISTTIFDIAIITIIISRHHHHHHGYQQLT